MGESGGHSRRVGRAAWERAEPFGAEALAEAMGLLHDLGKIKPGFQDKLDGIRNDVSHSVEGARVLSGTGGFAATIAGHHGRLPNPERLKDHWKLGGALNCPIGATCLH